MTCSFHLRAAIAASMVACSWLMGAAAAKADDAPVYKCPRVEAGDIEGTFFKTRVYQGKEGWFFRDGSDLQEFYEYGEGDLAYMGRFVTALKQRGVKLVYLPVPPRGMEHPDYAEPAIRQGADFDPDAAKADFETALKEWQRVGVIPVDVLHSPLPRPADKDFFFARDQHWRPVGAKIAAAAVKAALDSDPDYQSLDKKTFVTKDLGREDQIRSGMLLALQRMCTDTLLQETADAYETSAGEASANDLLGGDEGTPVALVGTSFSDIETFNFVGFLEEALGLEVANYAISGGGAFTSMLSYVQSDALETAPPKFLVWENPGYDRLDGEGINEFRQAIPAVYGYCDGDRKLGETKLKVEQDGTATIPIPADAKVSGHRFYLAIRAEDTGIRNMQFSIDYVDGDGEFFAIARADRAKPSERFFVEFSDDIPTTVKTVTVAGQPDRAVGLTVQLCKIPEGT